MKILIVDDESLARERLQRQLKEINADTEIECEIIEAENGLMALEKIQQHNPDIVLLDIRMPGMDGIAAATKISQLETPPAIIFTTAFDEYALDAFESHAIAYLLKPVRKEKLEKAIQSAKRLNRVQLQSIQPDDNHTKEDHLSVRIHSGVRKIDIKDIYYFQAEHKYVTVKYNGGEVIIEDPLKNLESRFAEDFIRIHRNALVAKQQLVAIRKDRQGRYLTDLKDVEEKLEVSRRHVAIVRQFLK
ncbi:MAG: LytTR family DNA-binding domain-containing protein [Gammaproteobacteria bacterium]|nr:LytTR family DNA-binding domain-containing protein [Gammaproteobacteria bacterium]